MVRNFGYVLAAYAIIWGLLAVYLGRMTIRFARLKKEYSHLKKYQPDTGIQEG